MFDFFYYISWGGKLQGLSGGARAGILVEEALSAHDGLDRLFGANLRPDIFEKGVDRYPHRVYTLSIPHRGI